ncbi:MAG: hypothetical protein MUC42_12570 [Bryobacter sp.]|jgi:hypothetical protein|nr:hypothetical protein [Bryobacter sp.]
MVTQHWVRALIWALSVTAPISAAQEMDYQVYTESPRILLNQRRLRLLRRERERDTIRWQQFSALMAGNARMDEPGFAKALYSVVAATPAPCREAVDWAVKSASVSDAAQLREMAIVYDWCAASVPESSSGMLARRLSVVLKSRPLEPAQVRSAVFAALALADIEGEAAQAVLKHAAEAWWSKRVLPQLTAHRMPFKSREDLYAVAEFLHVMRDNFRVDLREGGSKWFEELPAMLLLSYYPQPWPAAENEYRIPAYVGKQDPSLREATFSRVTEFALVAYDGNAQPHQFLQGWLLQDRFLLRSPLGTPYEFLWANPYLPGLSFTYMPDLFHAHGRLFTRAGWDEDAPWFGFWDGQAQFFRAGQRVQVNPGSKPAPLELGPIRVFFTGEATRFERGWTPPVEEGEKPVEEAAFVLGLEPETAYDVEVDLEEIVEMRSDSGGILAFRFAPGLKAQVRLKKASPAAR